MAENHRYQEDHTENPSGEHHKRAQKVEEISSQVAGRKDDPAGCLEISPKLVQSCTTLYGTLLSEQYDRSVRKTIHKEISRMYVTVDTLITAGAVLGAIVSFVTLFWKLFKWIDHQKEQDQEIANMKTHFEQDIKELRDKHESDNSFIQEEQTLVIYGLLACLKGLKEQGCNGSVTEAIDKIEKHINQKAHHH